MKKNLCRTLAVCQILALFLTLFSISNVQAQKIKSPETVYSNTTPITINTTSGLTAPTVATGYPSNIEVSGMTGSVTNVAVTLNGVNHTSLSHLDFLLVGPTGEKFIFLSDVGGFSVINDQIYTITDSAAQNFPTFTTVTSGTYKPTSGDSITDVFPAPAPAGPYNQPPSATFASVYNGTNPNGTWSLFVADDTLFNPGSINSGWSLTITTGGAPMTFTNSNYIGLNDVLAQSAPYGTTINVSGVSGVISELKVGINGFTHAFPRDVDILLVSPNGKGLVLLSDVGSGAASNADLVFDDEASATIDTSTPIVSGNYKPSDQSSANDADTFPSPAPLRPYLVNGSQLSNFDGFSPNGEWRLFVVDDSPNNSGMISGGWSLDITTVPVTPPTPTSCSAPTFSPTSFPTGINPTNVSVTDFNNDDNVDLAVTNQVTNDVSILLGDGNGNFASQPAITVGMGPYAIVAGKFNADNNFDLAITNSGSNTVSILLGNGDGTFSSPMNFFVGAAPISIAAGDVNNDGKADLVVANFGGFFSGSVSVLLGNGTGGFTAGNNVRTRTQPAFVTIAELNGDGNKDILVANFGADSVSTFFGNGSGTFQLNQNIMTGAGPVSIRLADLGTDGIADLVVANYNADSLTTCSGNSNGGFTGCGLNNPVGQNPISVTVADFTGSGVNATATALSGSNLVRVLTSNVSVGQNPNAIETADFNEDGKPDLVTVNSGSNDVSILINGCQAAKGSLFDYNGDRRTDYSVFRPGNTSYYVHQLNPNSSAQVFGQPADVQVPADYNGDLLTDFAVYRPSNGLWFIIDRNSRPIYFIQFGLPDDIPAPADFDGDGKADITVWRPSDGNWYIRRSSDNALQITNFGMNGDRPVAADFDGDGKADIAVFRPSNGVWYIWRSSDGKITFTNFGLAEDKTVAADYDGDGKDDIAVWRPSTGVWYVLKSSDGGFTAFAWGMSGDIPVLGDYEGDGKFDYAVWRPSDTVWYIRKSSDGGAIFFQWGITTDYPLPNAFVR